MNLEVEPKHAKLTRFLCQELLYEYLSGTLDRRRAADVEAYLPTCRDSQRALDHLKKGLAYARDVSNAQISPPLHQALLAFEPAWKKRLQGLTLWSSQRGWRLLPPVFLVLALVLGLAVSQPWKVEHRMDTELAQQKQLPHSPTEGAAVPTVAVNATNPTSTPPPIPATASNSVLAPNPTPLATQSPSPSSMTNVTAAPTQVAEPAPPAPAPSSGQPSEAKTTVLTTAPTISANYNDSTAGSGRGMLYRSDISVKSFPTTWPTIRDKIVAFGGTAAGAVELGWQRQPGESYFHFALPESNYAEFEAFLKTFGPVRISKEHHPRVMPKGKIRIILTVKDGETHESSGEAP